MAPIDPEKSFPICRSLLGDQTWKGLVRGWRAGQRNEFVDFVAHNAARYGDFEYVADLARLEQAVHEAERAVVPDTVDCLLVNPSLRLLEVSWRDLPALLSRGGRDAAPKLCPGSENLLVWFSSDEGMVRVRRATGEDLLVLKMVIEEIDPLDVAAAGNVSVGLIDAALSRAVSREIILAPPSKIRRDPQDFPPDRETGDRFASSPVFTLQWHITQACDLHCKHCYDRSSRPPVSLEQGIAVLDDLRAFCRARNVRGQVSLSGGNPLLHPHFLELYRAAADRGFSTAILGNPATREEMEDILAIREPVFFQVSLEGLEEHNDYIRGPGHFQRVMAFLELLKELRVYSMVMLTLTRANIDQVLPLAEILRHKTDLFTFNRLAMVGEGKNLLSVEPGDFAAFLAEYHEAARGNSVMSLKDNLFNVLRHDQGLALLGGCAGYGCGAAFNFLAALPDGEVHACRKFPSPVGNIHDQGLADIYDSAAARQYRAGCADCRECPIRSCCGGCLAVAHGFGLDIFAQKDPYCFFPVTA